MHMHMHSMHTACAQHGPTSPHKLEAVLRPHVHVPRLQPYASRSSAASMSRSCAIGTRPWATASSYCVWKTCSIARRSRPAEARCGALLVAPELTALASRDPSLGSWLRYLLKASQLSRLGLNRRLRCGPKVDFADPALPNRPGRGGGCSTSLGSPRWMARRCPRPRRRTPCCTHARCVPPRRNPCYPRHVCSPSASTRRTTRRSPSCWETPA